MHKLKKIEMESNSNNLQWLCIAGVTDDHPIWSTRFKGFAQTKGLFDTLTGDDVPPDPPNRLANVASDEERGAHDAATEAYTRALDEIEKRKEYSMVLSCNGSRYHKLDVDQA